MVPIRLATFPKSSFLKSTSRKTCFSFWDFVPGTSQGPPCVVAHAWYGAFCFLKKTPQIFGGVITSKNRKQKKQRNQLKVQETTHSRIGKAKSSAGILKILGTIFLFPLTKSRALFIFMILGLMEITGNP